MLTCRIGTSRFCKRKGNLAMSYIRFAFLTCFGVCGIPFAHADKLSDDINSIWDKPGGGLPSMGARVEPNGSTSVWVILPDSIIGSAVRTEQEVTVVEAFLNRWGSRFCSTLFNFQQPHSDMLVTVAREIEGPEVTTKNEHPRKGNSIKCSERALLPHRAYLGQDCHQLCTCV